MVLPGCRSHAEWPSPVPRIASGKISTSRARSVPSAAGSAAEPMKLPGWIDAMPIGTTSLTLKLSASTRRITSPRRSLTTSVVPSNDSTVPRRRSVGLVGAAWPRAATQTTANAAEINGFMSALSRCRGKGPARGNLLHEDGTARASRVRRAGRASCRSEARTARRRSEVARPAHGESDTWHELDAGDALVDRHLNERVEGRRAAYGQRQTGADVDGGRAAVVGLGLRAPIMAAPARIQLHDAADGFAEGVRPAGRDLDTSTGLECLVAVERMRHAGLAERGVDCTERMADRHAEHEVGRTRAGLQGTLGTHTVGIRHRCRAGRQLQAAIEGVRGGHVVGQELPAGEPLHIAEAREAPLLRRGREAGLGVDQVVEVVAMDDRQAQRHRPLRAEAIAQGRDDVEIAGVPLDRIFVAHLAGVDVVRAGSQTGLVDLLDAQVGAPAEVWIAGALRVPVGHQRAIGRAAGGPAGDGRGGQTRGDRPGEKTRSLHGRLSEKATRVPAARSAGPDTPPGDAATRPAQREERDRHAPFRRGTAVAGNEPTDPRAGRLRPK